MGRQMTLEEFQYLTRMLKERSGLTIGPEKEYLLENRLVPVARRHSLDGLPALVARMRMPGGMQIEQDVIEAMTTNESFFFRDKRPFDQLIKVMLPYLLEKRAESKTIRIWSAACAGGQEPYSIAMLLREQAMLLAGWRCEIVATDISREVLAKAKAGVYSHFEVQRGLPIQMLVKHFKQDGDRWRIDSALRGMIDFREFNLLSDPRTLGLFDVVFCRNVLIYFDQATKARVLDRVRAATLEDGYLCLGGAETVLGISDCFKLLAGERGVYRPNKAASPRRAVETAAHTASRVGR
jgi:chemotaxis protein methyltransferase CheR